MNDSSASSVYILVSWPYAVRYGSTAASAAQIQPARRPKSVEAAQYAAGMQASANSTESACVERSPSPKAPIHPCSSR